MIYIVIAGIIAAALVSVVKMGIEHDKFTREMKERMRLQSPQAQPKNIKLPFFEMEFERNAPQADNSLSRSELKSLIRETMLEVVNPLEERLSALENNTSLKNSSGIQEKTIPDESSDMVEDLEKRIGRQRTS
ncbi:MAG: hypothetical protein J0L94_06175 [Rhodothermia bacterium]|nr:hypothetical protein [Rhodothermia bacterium]